MRSARPAARTRSVAASNWLRDSVTPTQCAPKCWAARSTRAPQPQPMSSRRWPGCRRILVRMWSSFLRWAVADRKSTRLNSSHLVISYAVFCLKKKMQYELPRECWHFEHFHPDLAAHAASEQLVATYR